jgi:hypothetical protein
MPVELYIENMDHNGLSISTYQVQKPNLSYKLRDMGSCAWEIALSQKNLAGNPITENEFASQKTDYMLKASEDEGATFSDLQGGRLLDVGLDSDTGVIQCSGKDWLEYLNQPFPFDYSLDPTTINDANDNIFRAYVGAAGTDTSNVKYSSTQQSIIEDIINNNANFLSDIAYSPNFLGTGWIEVLEYFFQIPDTTTILAHIQAIGALADPFGFDFWCESDKTIQFYAPRFVTSPSSVVTLFDLVYGDEAVAKATWHNKGPKATDVVAKTSTGLWNQANPYPPSVEVYREFLAVEDLQDRFNIATNLASLQAFIAAGAAALAQLYRNPQKDLTLTVHPNLLFPTSELAGFETMVGQGMSYDSGIQFMPYHRINAVYWIVSQDYHSEDDSGNYLLDLGLQQIYPT